MGSTATALTQKERKLYHKLDEAITGYGNAPGALIPVLQDAQGVFGYLPEEVQRYIADKLNIPIAKVFGVVSFYTFFSMKPRGKHQIRVCLGTACYVRGAQRILDRFSQELGLEEGETTEDKKYTLETCRCLGACAIAPVITVTGKTHRKVTPTGVSKILKEYK